MQLPQIQIRSQMAKINIQQTNGTQQISQPKADVSIKQPQASLSIHARPSKLRVDQTQAFAEANLMSILRRNDQFAAKGLADSKQGAARRAREGTDLMKIENQSQPIMSHAKVNSERPQKQLGIDFIPSPLSVNIDYQPGDLQIDAQANAPAIQAHQNKPTHQYKPGSVAISMVQQADLDIQFSNLYA